MLKNHPLMWVILLAGLVVLMTDYLWVDLASFSILALGSIIAIWKWGRPLFKRWRANRVYSLSFTDSFESKIADKSKAISIGKQVIFIRIKMKSPKYISQVGFHFRKSDERDGGGYASASIISFEHVAVNNMENLPYESCLYPNEQFQHGTQAARATFTPVRLLKKEEILIFAFTVDAKLPWHGRFYMEASDETGKGISRSLELNIMDSP